MLESPIKQIETPNFSNELSIGRLLIEWGKLTEKDVEGILFQQRSNYCLFGEIASSMGLITDADIRSALEYQRRNERSGAEDAKRKSKLTMARPLESQEADAFRELRLQLTKIWFSQGQKSLAFISVDEKIGTSLFIANLALTFAQSNRSTLLIDANLRRPSQQELFDLRSETGLVEILSNAELMHFTPSETLFHRLSVLRAGKTTSTSFELLAGNQFPKLLRRLSPLFDITLIDLPSLHLGVEALDVATQVGGALLVTRTHLTRIPEISQVEKKLKQLGVCVVGSVLIDM